MPRRITYSTNENHIHTILQLFKMHTNTYIVLFTNTIVSTPAGTIISNALYNLALHPHGACDLVWLCHPGNIGPESGTLCTVLYSFVQFCTVLYNFACLNRLGFSILRYQTRHCTEFCTIKLPLVRSDDRASAQKSLRTAAKRR